MKLLQSQNLSLLLSLFASSSTLICCALPILLTMLGLGSVLFALVENVPFLFTLTANKHYLFLIVSVMLGLNYWWIFRRRSKSRDCEIIDDSQNDGKIESISACDLGNNVSKLIFKVSLAIYCVGLFFAYLLLPIYQLW